MQYNFSEKKKFSTWRKLWTYLAKAEKVLKLFKGSAGSQLPGHRIGKLQPSTENESSKQGKHVVVYSPIPTMSQSDSYQETWIKDLSSKQDPFSWPSSILQLNSLNQSPGSVSEWYTDGPAVQRPLMRQRSSDIESKPAVDQDLYGFNSDVNHVTSRSSVYHLLVARAQQDLLRSTDSSLYSDPEGQRPFSSESSGSARSSFSMSTLDGSTTSSNSTGSSSASWDQGLLNEMMDSGYSDTGNQRLVKDRFCQYSQYPSWQAEEQSAAYMSSDLNNNKLGIWSSRFQSPEDHQLIDDLFMKEEKPSRTQSAGYGNSSITSALQSLSLSNNNASNANFGRAIQPPQSLYSISSRGHFNSSS
ncbi:hypothetical protein FOCC_FOCC018033 [Frankliniella occidentalis]|nr:hypothetical protein FOCC_FOCC018033 [Frankliniella occidentalis]